ncbi:MAG TPA: lantibiotic dehydratase [Chryseosolibacter sp.]
MLLKAIFFASPSLIEEVGAFLRGGEVDEKEQQKILVSIFKYYLRATYRCTPFGLFAGISLAEIGSTTSLTLTSRNNYQIKTRLDTHLLSIIAQKIASDEQVRDSITWYANNTIYEIGQKIRFIEYRISNKSRTHHLTQVDSSSYLRNVLNRAQRGATRNDLAAMLISDKITREEALGFVDEMIAVRLLVSELEPLVTGSEYHFQLIEKLSKSLLVNHSEKIRTLVEELKRLDCSENKSEISNYQTLLGKVAEDLPGVDKGQIFQCDLLKPGVGCSIGENVIVELNRAITLLNTITDEPDKTRLADFIEKFTKRYESQEKPLLEVLDLESGIGFPVNENHSADRAPLLDNLHWEDTSLSLGYRVKINKWNKYLFEKFHQAISRGEIEIELADDEIASHFRHQVNASQFLPDSAFTLCSIVAASAEEINNGNFRLYHEITAGPSAANSFGRFCFMNEDLTALTKQALKQEEALRPDCVYAEITHIPHSRIGNILMRPAFRRYEIPILTRPSVHQEDVIALNDLMISIKKGRIVLRSRRLDKEVIPRLTTAHNFTMNPLPVYHFLGDLQFQNIKGNLSWNWGVLKEMPFLPRVRYRKIILAKATWTISLAQLSPGRAPNDGDLGRMLIEFFKVKRIPNHVTLVQGDNQLPIDIRNSYCASILAHELRKHNTIVIQESLFAGDDLALKGPEGGFTNEIVIPWIKKISGEPSNALTGTNRQHHVGERDYPPGSEWHYVKIYCAVKTADLILVEVIKPLVEELLRESIIQKFFFIRYYDPDHHLRIRFHGQGLFFAQVTERLNTALEPFIASNLIFNIQTEMYSREIERYGAKNINNTESLFFADSVATLEILSLLEGDEGDDLRWKLAIKGVNDMLDAFNFSLAIKKDLMYSLSIGFAKEFNADDQETKKQLSAKFRECRPSIRLMFEEEVDQGNELFTVWQIFQRRKEAIASCAGEINNLVAQKELSVGILDLLASYIHMFLNRFLRSKQRLHEMVIYDLLHQHYKSLLAQHKTK